MTTRIVFLLYPDARPNDYTGDSGRIDGRIGLAPIITGSPLLEEGKMLEFADYADALEGAKSRGLDERHIFQTTITVLTPQPDPQLAR